MKAQNVTSMVLASVLLAGCSKAVLAEPGPGEQPPSVGALLGYIADQFEYERFNQVLFASGYRNVLRLRLAEEPLTVLPVDNSYFERLSRPEMDALINDEATAYEFITRHVLIGEWTAEAIARAEFLPSVYDEEQGQDPSVPGGLGNEWELGVNGCITDIQRADEGWVIGTDWPVHLANRPGNSSIGPTASIRVWDFAGPAPAPGRSVNISNNSARHTLQIVVTHSNNTTTTINVPPGKNQNFGFNDALTIDIVNPHSVAVGIAYNVGPC